MADGLEALLLQREVEAFLYSEARLLDARRFDAWCDLFTEDAVYWVPVDGTAQDPRASHAIFYETRDLLKVRARRLGHPHLHAQTPPSRTCHLVGNVAIADDTSGDELEVISSLIMLEYRDDAQRIFGGECRHRLRREGGALRIAFKRVDLVNSGAAHGFMTVPF